MLDPLGNYCENVSVGLGWCVAVCAFGCGAALDGYHQESEREKEKAATPITIELGDIRKRIQIKRRRGASARVTGVCLLFSIGVWHPPT